MTAILNILLSILFLISSLSGSFQEEQLQIRMSRNWGFSSGTGRIQGTFTIVASGPEDLTQVVFYIDDQIIGEVDESPFDHRFVTDDYPLGSHQISAIGTTASGDELVSNLVQLEFVSADQGWQAAGNIIIPLVVVILAAIGLAVIVPLIFTRGKKEQLPPGAPRSYGYYGGAICPKCSRPFSRHIYGLNLGLHKYDRCPYCGKWSLVKRASKEELEAAEAAEIAAAQEGIFEPQISEEETFRRDLEDSRFED
jgi:DNA-directed RNA polymerase subunit RPC12/RpoP